MRVHESTRTIELTERNLRALLVKLAGHPADSARTLSRQGWSVVAVPDDEHYAERPPGALHPATDSRLAAVA